MQIALFSPVLQKNHDCGSLTHSSNIFSSWTQYSQGKMREAEAAG